MFTKKLLFIITILLSLTISAQITTSTVSGKVLNNNLTVANANITLTHLPTNFKYKASSNKDGQFGLENLTVGGPYEITVYSDGFKIFKNSNINLSLGDNELQNILLVKEESVLSEVVIAGKKGVSKIGSSNNFSEKTINSLPNIFVDSSGKNIWIKTGS